MTCQTYINPTLQKQNHKARLKEKIRNQSVDIKTFKYFKLLATISHHEKPKSEASQYP